MAVSPGQNILFTCDPKLITQLLRDPAFGKPTALLGLLNLFGPTMTGTDGPEAKLYRKIVSPYFSNPTMEVVFRESLEATESFMKIVAGQTAPVDTQLRPMLSKMALHVLGKCGFRKEGPCLEELKFTETPPQGHVLSFADAFLGIDQDLPLIALTPPLILKYSPLKSHKRGRVLRNEMQQYLEETMERKPNINDLDGTNSKTLLDLLIDANENNNLLSREQVMGNIFILNFAGHESNAHVLQFALLNLSYRPEMQKRLQLDIDKILGNVPREEWTYASHYNALAHSMVGAVINESLRVYTVLPIFMKETTAYPVQTTIDGRSHVIPPKTLIMINTSATHRNPKYWRTPQGSKGEGMPYAASSFNPDQWFDPDGKFRDPEPGSYIPFSDGSRGCIGQRFAMVELCVSLAAIMKDHNIDVVAGENMAHKLSGGIVYNMTLRLGDKIPVRFTKRSH